MSFSGLVSSVIVLELKSKQNLLFGDVPQYNVYSD